MACETVQNLKAFAAVRNERQVHRSVAAWSRCYALFWLAASFPLLLAACVDQQPGSASGDRPLFAIACTHAPPAGAADRTLSAPAMVMVTAREIAVAPRPPGAELSWARQNQTDEPERTYIPPGQRCSIYRTF